MTPNELKTTYRALDRIHAAEENEAEAIALRLGMDGAAATGRGDSETGHRTEPGSPAHCSPIRSTR